jgi:hypothetical protein
MKKFNEQPLFFNQITSTSAMSKNSKDNILQNFKAHNNTLDDI